MDSFAVSICNGLFMKKSKTFDFLKVSMIFALVQLSFPIAGWFLGKAVQTMVSGFDHWIAFGLLAYIGGKMVYESFEKDKECKVFNPNDIKLILLMAIATSIDAMVVGLSLALIYSSIVFPSIIIGLTTFIVVFTGMKLGKNIGNIIKEKAELAGGLVLIGIGLKILVEHIFF
jgi:putative Mn2+ efflux pump MntP